MPDHYAVTCAARHDFEGFLERELEFRQALGYPPFGRLLRMVVEGRQEEQVIATANEAGQLLQMVAPRHGAQVLG